MYINNIYICLQRMYQKIKWYEYKILLKYFIVITLNIVKGLYKRKQQNYYYYNSST